MSGASKQSSRAEELGRDLEFYFLGIASNATRTQGNYDRFMEAVRELVRLASNQDTRDS